MNKKGQVNFVNRAYTILVIVIVVALVIASFFAMALLFPVLQDTGAQAIGVVGESMPNSAEANATVAYESTFVSVEKSMNNLQWFAYFLLVGLFFGLFIFMWEIRTHAFLLPIWFVLWIIILLVSIIISYNYYEVTSMPEVASSYTSGWGFTYYLTLGLPLIVTAFFLIGGIILFAMGRDTENSPGGFAV